MSELIINTDAFFALSPNEQKMQKNQLRHCYVEEKRKLVRSYRLSSKDDGRDIWVKAAAVCASLQADPKEFIHVCFANCNMQNGPYPNMLGSNWAVELWLKIKTADNMGRSMQDSPDISLEEEVAIMLRWMSYYLMQSVGKSDPLDTDVQRYLLSPTSPGFTAWYRCIFTMFDTEVMRRWANEACAELALRTDIGGELRRLGFQTDPLFNFQ